MNLGNLHSLLGLVTLNFTDCKAMKQTENNIIEIIDSNHREQTTLTVYLIIDMIAYEVV